MRAKCPVFDVAKLVGSKWTFLIIEQLASSQLSFNGIYRKIGLVSPKVLSSRLSDLETCGLAEKKVVFNKRQKKSVYCLSKKGVEMYEIFKLMKVWNSKYSSPDCHISECVNCAFYKERFSKNVI